MLVAAGAELLCCPSNFGGPDSLDVFRVRALENRVFVIVANRIGGELLGDIDAQFRGESRVIAPDGTVLCHAEGHEALDVIEIDLTAAHVKASVMSRDLAAEWARYGVSQVPRDPT